MDKILPFLILISFLIERVVDRLLSFIPDERREYPKVLVSSLLGILLCWGMDIGILSASGRLQFPWMVYMDYIVTGVVVGEGTGIISRLVEILNYNLKLKRIKMKEMR